MTTSVVYGRKGNRAAVRRNIEELQRPVSPSLSALDRRQSVLSLLSGAERRCNKPISHRENKPGRCRFSRSRAASDLPRWSPRARYPARLCRLAWLASKTTIWPSEHAEGSPLAESCSVATTPLAPDSGLTHCSVLSLSSINRPSCVQVKLVKSSADFNLPRVAVSRCSRHHGKIPMRLAEHGGEHLAVGTQRSDRNSCWCRV